MKSKKIIIAVDARPLTHPVSGISRMVSRILEQLTDSDFEIHLFAPSKWHHDFDNVVKQSNVIWNQSRGLLAKKPGIWYNTTLPLVLNRMKPNFYWGTQQTVPAFLSSKISVIITFNDFVSYRFPNTTRWASKIQQRILQKRSVRMAARIIAISKQTATDVQAFFDVTAERLRVAYPGYDAGNKKSKSDRKSQTDLPISIKGPYILSVSTLEPRKNYSTLIDAYLSYHRSESNQPYSLVLAGRRGWESPTFFEKLDKIQQETGSVIVLEGLRDEQIEALYEGASFFCLPSLYEGFGIPLLEALCHGKPAIVSDLDCFHEIAGDKALYLPATDIDAWATAIKQQVERHRSGAQKEVSFDCSSWGWNQTAQVYRDAFRELSS
ncbi:MAG: glycosyltransferase family 4 protein [Leptonema sp. (in: Bacteria)]|nr:glycosyltransferase family 4 protein [Leptonema sp. (in: bacteria)]